ncbi:MAG TPA: hypothetical protein VN964_04760, partial [Gemmatimonadales bacterium]|nr:hypothetical protein [Gemmatimonadales bacterium]
AVTCCASVGLPETTRKVLVVSGNPTEAQQVTARLSVALQGQFVNAPGGFSWLVTSGVSELQKLLAD